MERDYSNTKVSKKVRFELNFKTDNAKASPEKTFL